MPLAYILTTQITNMDAQDRALQWAGIRRLIHAHVYQNTGIQSSQYFRSQEDATNRLFRAVEDGKGLSVAGKKKLVDVVEHLARTVVIPAPHKPAIQALERDSMAAGQLTIGIKGMYRMGLQAGVATQIICDKRRKFFDYRHTTLMAPATRALRRVGYLFDELEAAVGKFKTYHRTLRAAEQSKLNALLCQVVSRMGNGLINSWKMLNLMQGSPCGITPAFKISGAYYLALAGNKGEFDLWRRMLIPSGSQYPTLQRHKVDPRDVLDMVKHFEPIFTRPARMVGGRDAIAAIAPYMKAGEPSIGMLRDLIPEERSARYKRECNAIITRWCG